MSSSSGSDDRIYSRSLINGFNKFTKQIALELVQEDIEIIVYLISEHIPNEESSCIKKGIQLVSVLKKYRLLSENNLDFFLELLEESLRVDLANRVKEYQDTSVNAVRNAPQAQIEERLPARKMETLFLVITGEPESITDPKIDQIKAKICAALQFKKSEVFYIEVSQDKESSFYSQISFQLPETEAKINQLQMDAVCKKTWLTDLEVVELTVDKKSCIKIAEKEKKSPKDPKKRNGEMQSRPALPRVQSVLALDPKLKIHCSQTFDTILAIHLPVGGLKIKLFKSMLWRCEAAMKIYQSKHKHSVDSQLGVIRFGNHSSAPICFPEEQKIVFLAKDLSHGLKVSSHVTPDSVCGGMEASGIADALVEACGLGKKMRREATKLCIIVHFLSTNSADMEHYRCPCGHDLVYQSHVLATHAIPLYIIGVDLDGRLASQKQVEENYLLSGITAITGGRYFQIQDIYVLEKLIKCIIKENNSIEKNMGTVNDVVITEINKQYGDVNEVHLAEHLKNSCLQFCRVDCIRENGKPLTPVSQISERVSWADNLDDAITAVNSMKKRISTRNDQSTSKPNSSPPSELTASGYSGIQKPSEISNVNQNPDLEISARMVRRQIERSAYYRPTTEKTNSS